MRYSFLVLFLLVVSYLSAQADADQEVVQFSGLVVTGDSLSPIPFTTVYRARDNKGTVTDVRGFFAIPALKGDTIRFSSVGYASTQFVIPDTLTANRYNVVQYLSRDTIFINTTYIYPWNTKEKMKQEILALNLDDDATERARKNLESIMLYNRMAEVGMDGSENFKYSMLQQSQRISYAGQVPPQNIFSPVAWAQFIQAWKDGAYRRRQ